MAIAIEINLIDGFTYYLNRLKHCPKKAGYLTHASVIAQQFTEQEKN